LIKGGKTEVVRISLGDFSIERQKILGKTFLLSHLGMKNNNVQRHI
jgi:hypothetical protein